MAIDGLDITHQDDTTHGEYRATLPDNDAVGRLTWQARGGNVREVDHTLVPAEIGGRGVAEALTQAIVADAQDQGFTILPTCSYVAAQFRRHPEWGELRAPLES